MKKKKKNRKIYLKKKKLYSVIDPTIVSPIGTFTLLSTNKIRTWSDPNYDITHLPFDCIF